MRFLLLWVALAVWWQGVVRNRKPIPCQISFKGKGRLGADGTRVHLVLEPGLVLYSALTFVNEIWSVPFMPNVLHFRIPVLRYYCDLIKV